MLLALLATTTILASGATETVPAAPATQAPMTEAEIAAAKAQVAAKYVCRNEQVTGSRFPQKVCRNKAEMAAKQQEDQDRVRQQQRWTGGTVR